MAPPSDDDIIFRRLTEKCDDIIFRAQMEDKIKMSELGSTSTVTISTGSKMDEVDQKQQREIDANRIWVRAVSWSMALLVVFGIAIFILLMRAINCPHLECPHHILEKTNG